MCSGEENQVFVHPYLLVPEWDVCSERGCSDGAVSMLTQPSMDPEVRLYFGHEPRWVSDMQLAWSFVGRALEDRWEAAQSLKAGCGKC